MWGGHSCPPLASSKKMRGSTVKVATIRNAGLLNPQSLRKKKVATYQTVLTRGLRRIFSSRVTNVKASARAVAPMIRSTGSFG
jgi:hypothetical protein